MIQDFILATGIKMNWLDYTFVMSMAILSTEEILGGQVLSDICQMADPRNCP